MNGSTTFSLTGVIGSANGGTATTTALGSYAFLSSGLLATSTGLTAANFATTSVSQWANDAHYLATSTNLGVANFATSSVSQFANDKGYISTTTYQSLNGWGGLSWSVLGSGNVTSTVVNGSTTFSLTGVIGSANGGTATTTALGSYAFLSSGLLATSTGLTAANFATTSVSQWANDAHYLATSTNLGVANFATSSVSQFANDKGYISTTTYQSLNGWGGLSWSVLGSGNVTSTVVNGSTTFSLTGVIGSANGGTATTTALGSYAFLSSGLLATSTGLTAANFATTSVSQWANDAHYLATSTNLGVANFATSSVSQFANDAGYATSTGLPSYSVSSANAYLTVSTTTGQATLTFSTSSFGSNAFNSTAFLSTSTGLTAANFATTSVSQWANDAHYLATSTNLGVANFATSSVSQFANDKGYISTTTYQSLNGWGGLSWSVLGSGNVTSTVVNGSTTFSLTGVIGSANGGTATTTALGSYAFLSSGLLATSTGLTAANFATTSVSQWANDAHYLATSTNLGVANFATSSVSQFANDKGYISTTTYQSLNGWGGLSWSVLGSGNVTSTVVNGSTTFALINSGVASGTYTCTNLTVSSSGLVTAAANGICGGGSGAISTSSAATAGYFPYWFNATGGLAGTSTIFFSSSTGSLAIGTTTGSRVRSCPSVRPPMPSPCSPTATRICSAR